MAFLDDQYAELRRVYELSFDHAASGKGHVRHSTGDKPFEEQVSCWIEREGFGYASGQAVKKLHESLRLPPEQAISEILGAMNFCAIAILGIEERHRTE